MGSGTGGGAGAIPPGGPVVGGPTNPPGGDGPIDTALTLSCVGPAENFSAVHGVLDPSLAGQMIEIDYVPVDPNADTVIHYVTTGAAERFADAAGGSRFVRAIAFFAGDDTYVASEGYCP